VIDFLFGVYTGSTNSTSYHGNTFQKQRVLQSYCCLRKVRQNSAESHSVNRLEMIDILSQRCATFLTEIHCDLFMYYRLFFFRARPEARLSYGAQKLYFDALVEAHNLRQISLFEYITRQSKKGENIFSFGQVL
jgi:hypothetical protein